mmetsp:Transcript_119402/g.337828  ORF Transcript_119402/g.337828 Transcript_119402/m.337828 type:complete len:174 (-) Transcript_119402:23-544(-)
MPRWLHARPAMEAACQRGSAGDSCAVKSSAHARRKTPGAEPAKKWSAKCGTLCASAQPGSPRAFLASRSGHSAASLAATPTLCQAASEAHLAAATGGRSVVVGVSAVVSAGATFDGHGGPACCDTREAGGSPLQTIAVPSCAYCAYTAIRPVRSQVTPGRWVSTSASGDDLDM